MSTSVFGPERIQPSKHYTTRQHLAVLIRLLLIILNGTKCFLWGLAGLSQYW